VRSPGRLEVAGLSPTVVIDGAHNAEGFRGLAETLADEFAEEQWVLVLGIRGDREIGSLITPLQGKVAKVVATEAKDRLAIAAPKVAAAAEKVLGVAADVVVPVPDAVDAAMAQVDDGVGLAVAGSLYVAGEARHALGLDSAPSPVHRRFQAEIGE